MYRVRCIGAKQHKRSGLKNDHTTESAPQTAHHKLHIAEFHNSAASGKPRGSKANDRRCISSSVWGAHRRSGLMRHLSAIFLHLAKWMLPIHKVWFWLLNIDNGMVRYLMGFITSDDDSPLLYNGQGIWGYFAGAGVCYSASTALFTHDVPIFHPSNFQMFILVRVWGGGRLDQGWDAPWIGYQYIADIPIFKGDETPQSNSFHDNHNRQIWRITHFKQLWSAECEVPFCFINPWKKWKIFFLKKRTISRYIQFTLWQHSLEN